MPLIASDLEAVTISRKGSGEGINGEGKTIVDHPAVDAERKTYPLAQNVVKGATSRMDWE